jgi:hypothetical protein
MSTKRAERVLGPWEQRGGWRVMVVHADGTRTTRLLATEDMARRYIDGMTAALATEAHTTTTALVEYADHLKAKGYKPTSLHVTLWCIAQMLPEDLPLRTLDAKRSAALYDQLRTRPSPRTGAPLAVDSHRNVLARTRSFLLWCVKRGWLAANPLADVEGIGKRRPRGKSLGKSGAELRVKQARAWYHKALELATAGTRARSPRWSRCCWGCARGRSCRGARVTSTRTRRLATCYGSRARRRPPAVARSKCPPSCARSSSLARRARRPGATGEPGAQPPTARD